MMNVKKMEMGDVVLTIARYARNGEYVYSVGSDEYSPEDCRRKQCDSLNEAKDIFDEILCRIAD